MFRSRRVLLAATVAAVLTPSSALAAWRRRWRRSRTAATQNRPLGSANSIVLDSAWGTFGPNADAWSKIAVGMTESQVLLILGPPLQRATPAAPPLSVPSDVVFIDTWHYGQLCFDSDALPGPLGYQLFFRDHKVESIADPFGGARSEGGLPTVPQPTVPHDGVAYSHYPRYVDLRWTPSAGQLPVTYEVELEIEHCGPQRYSTQIPYLAIEYAGDQQGRWSVRALNKLGTSQWSQPRTFRFKTGA